MNVTRAAIDVGGTFTDCLVLDEDGSLSAFKAPTTPEDPTQGLLNSLDKAARARNVTLDGFLGQLEMIIHGTTLATNALLTGRTAQVGMLTTKGFRDVIEARRGYKNVHTSMYELFVPPYRPLVRRHRRLPVTERTLPDGSIAVPLDEADARQAIQRLIAEGVDAIAICLLHSYANPANEERLVELCHECFDGTKYVATSHDVLPVWGEYERFSTTVVSAAIGPTISAHLLRLEACLAERGFGGQLLIVQSDGLMQSAAGARRRAVELVGSGPAAAPVGALQWAIASSGRNLVSVDMGGTSFDVCLITAGEVPTTTEGWVGDERVAIKLVDVHSVGAGGGSIAWLDSVGLLRVGPQSASAEPGPACYAKGGTQPTVTDADVLLGYVPGDYFLGGEISIDAGLARAAMRGIGGQLGMDETQTAAAIFSTVNATMADQITELSTKRGIDIRDYALIVGGGAGAVHAAGIAEHLEMSTVVIPRYSALFSAFGMFAMDIGREYVRTYVVQAPSLDLARLAQLYEEMERQAIHELAASNVEPGDITFSRTAEVRYVGQFHDVEVGLPAVPAAAAGVEQIVADFHERHRDLYGFNLPFRTIEFTFFRLKATVRKHDFTLATVQPGSANPSKAFKRSRQCFFGGCWVETPCFHADGLKAGNLIAGPALIEDRTTTVVVPERFTCTVDTNRTFVLERS